MKQLYLFLNIMIAALLSTPVHSAPIQVFANNVITTFGDFSTTPGGPVLGADRNAVIQSIIANNPATAIYGGSTTTRSVIDLDFGDITASTGAGADLVIYSLWNGLSYNFGLEAYGTDPTAGLLSSFNYSVAGCTATDISAGICTTDISATSIDLFGSNGLALDDGIDIGYIRLFIGGSFYNGDGNSNISLVGSIYNDAAVVPLPLSAVLFSSGLALLGWVGRRKTL